MKTNRIGRSSVQVSSKSRGLVSLDESALQHIAGGQSCDEYSDTDEDGITWYGPAHDGYIHNDAGVSGTSLSAKLAR